MNYQHIALSASAGSGKTFTLSVRFIALLLDGAAINDVVALTFTTKAVGEMKERIQEVFCDLENRPAELAALEGMLNISKEEILSKRAKLLDGFLASELKIYTFDAFFAQILRLFASYLGLRPDFELVNKQDKSEWFLSALSDEQAEHISSVLAEYDISLKVFLASLEQIYQNYSGSFAPINHCAKPDLLQVFKDNEAALRASKNAKIASWCDQVQNEQDLLNKPCMQIYSSATSVKVAAKSASFELAANALNQAVAEYFQAKEATLLQICFDYAKLYCKCARLKHQQLGRLSFSDVASYVHEILQDPELKDLFYFRLNSGIKHLLIDEFQDTSIIQYEIIRPLVDEIAAGIGIDDAPKSFFYVGDKKQSIYSFRGANQAVFDLFANESKYNIARQNLDTNYRSYSEVVEFCNDVFAASDYGDEFIRAKSAKPSGGMVRVFKDVEDEEQMFRLVLASIKQLSGEVCILVRKNATAAALMDFLAANNIAASSGSARALVNDLSVRVLLEFAKYCVFGDSAYAAFVRECLGCCPSRCELDLLRPANETFMFLARYLGLELGENLLEFIASASERFLDNLYEESEEAAAVTASERVKVMTVHKSKGLQFEHLICLQPASRDTPDVGLKLQYDFAQSAWSGFLKSKKEINEIRKRQDAKFAQQLARYEQAEAENELNVAYVAYTRAVKSLVIICEQKCKMPVELPDSHDASAWLEAGEMAAGAGGAGGADNSDAGDGAGDGIAQVVDISENSPVLEKLPTYRFDAQIPAQKVKNSAYNEQIELGLAFHYFCELSDFTPASLQPCLALASARFSAVDKTALGQLAKQLLDCGEFLELIKGCVLVKELAFMEQNGGLGRVDLIAYSSEKICIIDYKSGADSSEYHAQLERYKQALISCDFAATVGVSAQIECYLLLNCPTGFFLKKV